ncbi:hypothetical protein [Xanthomarina sp. GH4-25]|uniref:hypothetical protein n=1 Tax=Xanthomarina sp. GH4-25 TaxID=3349335 RepID=UPI000D67A3B6|nr:hypothetical protein DI383_10845 [Flavobacteriaceae bacterium LYZ1037]
MREFLYEYYSPVTKCFIIFAFIVGILVYKKYKKTQVKYFIWFLGWIVFLEIVGSYPLYLQNSGLSHLIKGTLIEQNYWWYTISWASTATIFYSWFLSQKYESNIFKTIIKLCIYGYVLVILVSAIIDYKIIFGIRPTYITVLNVTIIILSTVFYLYNLINSEKLLNSFKSLYFYVAIILLVWWLITTPLSFFEVYNSDSDWDFVTIKWTITLIANIFMYLGFALALLWCDPEQEI